MLIYHPAFDAFHCVFRLLVLINSNEELELAKLRILDYFLVFPAEIRNVRLPREHSYVKKTAKALVNIYRGPVSNRQVFREMEHIQHAALGALVAAGLIDKEKMIKGIVVRTHLSIPAAVRERVISSEMNSSPAGKYILNTMSHIRTNGIDGLKDRTGLMEFRYDNA